MLVAFLLASRILSALHHQRPVTNTHTIARHARRPSRKDAGFYQRPSAAIEKGGGFYVPGLEGNWRLIGPVAVVTLLALNRYGYGAEQPQLVSESLAVASSLALLAQGLLGEAVDLERTQDSGKVVHGIDSNTTVNVRRPADLIHLTPQLW